MTGPDKPVKVISDVPFFPQEEFQCGPASLAGVLNFRGVRVTPEEIAGEIYSRSARGTLNIDLMIYASKRGLISRQYQGGIDDLMARIDNGDPVILLVDLGVSLYKIHHFMVVKGYTDDAIIANSGRDEGKVISMDKLRRMWKKTGYWTLLITEDRE
ncbi:MAG: peptidase C39 family protein [Nitrospirota bacterium]|nr:MAG: peptidase C39 family protein [Nitrospirota bacterium]